MKHEQELNQYQTYRNLDSKLKILGMSALDLIVVLLFASVMNLIFGQTSLAPYFVFLLPSLMAFILYVGGRNKPDDYLVHLLRYYLDEGYVQSNQVSEDNRLVGRIYE